MVECARPRKLESTIKRVISVATVVVELRLADVVIKPIICRAVKVTPKVQKSTKERIWGSPIWGSPIVLQHLASKTEAVEDWAIVWMAIVIFKLFLRAGKLASLEHWTLYGDFVRFLPPLFL